MKNLSLKLPILMFLLPFDAQSVEANAQVCKASGKIKGRKPPPKKCNRQHFSNCCKDGNAYPVFHCWPMVTNHTKAIFTHNGLEKGADGGGPAECYNKFPSDKQLIVALSTGWFNKRGRCFKKIVIRGKGRTVKAEEVDGCDSTAGCNNFVDGSPGVWKAVGLPPNKRSNLKVTWTDA